MSKQYNKALKRQRRRKYLKRKKTGVKRGKTAPAVAAAPVVPSPSAEHSSPPVQNPVQVTAASAPAAPA